MRIPLLSQVCSGLLCSALILMAGCATNSASQSLASLSITATPSAVTVGGTVSLKATAHLTDGTTQDVTSSTLWSVSNPALATLANGVLTSKAAGTVNVAAAYVIAVSANSTSASGSSATPQTLNSSAQITINPNGAGSGGTTPLITWPTPASIAYGTPLGSTQLNASSSTPGTFTYSPAAGTVLATGAQTLNVTFTPNDTQTFSTATDTVQLTVTQAAPVITWGALATVKPGTALGSAQLDATASVPGTFSYNPAAGTVPAVGIQTLSVTFVPADTVNYATATATNTLTVLPTSSGNLTGSSKWQWNHDPGTPGSSTGTTTYPELSPATPDNAARKMYFTYTGHGGEIYHLSFAKDTAAHNFVYDTYIYLTDPSQIMNVEMDMNQVTSDGRTVILATQCAGSSGTFEYTTISNGGTHWHPSNIKCDPRKWSANTWHHVQIATHRDDSGNVTYDWVNIDGVSTNFQNASGPSAEALGWAGGDLLLNFQLDGANSSGTVTAYIDQMTIYRW